MRLIDADALKKRFEELHLHPDLIDLIDNAPTVFDDKAYSDGYTQGTCDCEHAHERPQGEWIAIKPYNHKTFCPFCKKDTRDMNYDNFCSNCGAKLKGGAE